MTQSTETNTVTKTELRQESIQEKIDENGNDAKEIVLKTLPCKDRNLQLVWKNLGEDETDFSSVEYPKNVSDCRNYISVSEFIDLNNDGQTEIIISGDKFPFCASGGCHYWIFQKRNKTRYKQIFDTIGSIKVRKSKTEGYRNLEYVFRYSTDEYTRIIYKFNGLKYVPKQCQKEHFTYIDKDGKIVVLKKPRITSYECKEAE